MIASLLRGFAVLLLGLSVNANAVTVSFGPNHSPTFLDATIDASDGYWENYGSASRQWVTPRISGGGDGTWSVGTNFGWDLVWGSVMIVNQPLFIGYQFSPADMFYYTQNGVHYPRLDISGNMEKVFQGGTWEAPIPTLTRLSDLSFRITWAAPSVPETGGVGAILSATLIALVAVRRRTEIVHRISRKDSAK